MTCPRRTENDSLSWVGVLGNSLPKLAVVGVGCSYAEEARSFLQYAEGSGIALPCDLGEDFGRASSACEENNYPTCVSEGIGALLT